MNKDAYWFQHDSNSKDDPKCILLIEELGLEGYGIFWVLIETLRDQSDFRASLRVVPGLARRYNTSTEKIKAVISRYELFQIENEEFFFSPSLLRRMQGLLEKKQNKKIAGIKGNLIKYNYATKEDLDGLTDSEIVALNDRKKGFSHSDRNPIALEEKREEEKREEESTINGCAIPDELISDNICEIYATYISYILEKYRMRITSMETSVHFAKLIQLKKKGNNPVEVISQTIEAGNKSFYEAQNFKRKQKTNANTKQSVDDFARSLDELDDYEEVHRPFHP